MALMTEILHSWSFWLLIKGEKAEMSAILTKSKWQSRDLVAKAAWSTSESRTRQGQLLLNLR